MITSLTLAALAATEFVVVDLGRLTPFGRTVDINADGIVSILDLSAVASNFGTPSPLAWPE